MNEYDEYANLNWLGKIIVIPMDKIMDTIFGLMGWLFETKETK